MPFSIEFEERGIVKRFHGYLSGGEFEASAQPMGSTPAFDSARYVIVDFSAIEGHDIQEPNLLYVRALQGACKVSNSYLRVALVIADPQLANMCRKVIADPSLGGYETHVVSSMEEARAWLGPGAATPGIHS